MFKYFNERVKGLDVWDISLTKISVFFFTLIIAKLFPIVLTISIPILILIVLVAAARPVYSFLFKKRSK